MDYERDLQLDLECGLRAGPLSGPHFSRYAVKPRLVSAVRYYAVNAVIIRHGTRGKETRVPLVLYGGKETPEHVVCYTRAIVTISLYAG